MRIAIVLLLVSATAIAGPSTAPVCSKQRLHCMAQIVVDEHGTPRANDAPEGLAPSDIQSAYQITTNLQAAPTVAIIDAYGYASLEQDLAQYRSQFGLPACTRANGCLTILDQSGATSPLPDDPPSDDDWTVETALDVDMISAACPACKIIVVQADDDAGDGLFVANNTAAAQHPTTISNSWGGSEQPDTLANEPYFQHAGIAVFASGGDSGYDNGGTGANYPATSQYVIGVGGTTLQTSGNSRGWIETAWSMGGNGCSSYIAKPAFQTASTCPNRASADVAAIGDPATGAAIYNHGAWNVVGGTSAASPIVAAIFAATGKGNATPASVAQMQSAFYDVTSGTNGSCGDILCNATVGWDGPTGWGTPNAAALAGNSGGGSGSGSAGTSSVAIDITSPTNGATVVPGFSVSATVTGDVVEVGLGIDGNLVETTTTAPYVFAAPLALSPGAHTIAIAAADPSSDVTVAQVQVVLVEDGAPADPTMTPVGCAATQPTGFAPIAFALLGLAKRRRRDTVGGACRRSIR